MVKNKLKQTGGKADLIDYNRGGMTLGNSAGFIPYVENIAGGIICKFDFQTNSPEESPHYCKIIYKIILFNQLFISNFAPKRHLRGCKVSALGCQFWKLMGNVME